MWMLMYLPLFAAATLMALLCADLLLPRFTFWPPPTKNSWQNRAFISLFRVMVYGLVILTALHIATSDTWSPDWPFVMGVMLVIIGFGLGFAATFGLGWRNAFGAKEGLRTDGLFRYSRNPIYVATWIGLSGWALITPDPIIIIVLALWAVGYLLAIFLEERWLTSQYGAAYQVYCQKVPRFAGVRQR